MKPIMIKKNIIRWKIYIDRCRMYITYIQFFLLGFLFLKEFPLIWTFVITFYYWTMPILLLMFILFSLLIGWAENKLGIIEEEQARISSLNPVLMDIKKDIEEIKKCLEKSEKKS